MQRDNAKIIRLLKTAKGQIDGILKMVETGQYCIDISNQILASQAILSKVNKEILNAHLHNCVMQSISDGDSEAKLDEVMSVLDKLLK
ncbi:MAG: metal-sensing transcriptional repressor [Corallococcus sp.]|nr:metal-sensing transcriptional repressor [Corallococcus sp.]